MKKREKLIVGGEMNKTFVEKDLDNIFKMAIKKGLRNLEEYMYIYSTEENYFFKHRESREYLKIERESKEIDFERFRPKKLKESVKRILIDWE